MGETRRPENRNSSVENRKIQIEPLSKAELQCLRPALEHALRYSYERQASEGEDPPEALKGLVGRISKGTPRNRPRFGKGDYSVIKSVLEAESVFRGDVAEHFRKHHICGLDDDTRSQGSRVKALSEESPEEEGSPEKTEIPDEDEEPEEQGPGRDPVQPMVELSECASCASLLFLSRPAGWRAVYGLHLRLSKAAEKSKEMDSRLDRQSKDLNKLKKQKRNWKEEKSRLSAQIQTLKKNPREDAKLAKELEGKLRDASRQLERREEDAARLTAQRDEAREDLRASKQRLYEEHKKWDGERMGKDAEIAKLQEETGSLVSKQRKNSTEALEQIREALETSDDHESLRKSAGEAIEQAARLLDVHLGPLDRRSVAVGELQIRPREKAELPPGIYDNSAEAAEHLLLNKSSFVIVDGYNFIFKRAADKRVDLAKEQLLGKHGLRVERQKLKKDLEEIHGRSRNVFLIVYDGKQSEVPLTRGRDSGVRETFSAEGESADSLIIRECRDAPRDRALVVVSADRGETAGDLGVRDPAESLGANLLSPVQLLHVIKKIRS